MTEPMNPGDKDDRLRLTRDVLRALPPLSPEDEAASVIIEGVLKAAVLLQMDDESTTEP